MIWQCLLNCVFVGLFFIFHVSTLNKTMNSMLNILVGGNARRVAKCRANYSEEKKAEERVKNTQQQQERRKRKREEKEAEPWARKYGFAVPDYGESFNWEEDQAMWVYLDVVTLQYLTQ